MKHAKIIGLAAIAVLAVTAFVGVASASAASTELCSTNTAPCSGTKYLSGTSVSAKLKGTSVAKLETNLVTVTCTASTVGGKTTSSGGAGAVTGQISSLTFGGTCKTGGGTTCEVTVLHLATPYNASIEATGGGNGAMTVTTGSSGKPGATVHCGSFINCSFETASAALTVTGGNPAVAKAEGIELEHSNGAFCPAEAFWTAEYEVTAPKPLFVV